MKDTIRYYYNIVEDDYYEYDSYSILQKDITIYVFKKLNVDLEYFKNILNVLNSNNVKINKIILNKENNFYTEYNGCNYILFEIIDKSVINKFRIFDIYMVNYNDNISNMWEQKIEFYMKQIKEFGLGKNMLINTFNYYVGMSENALAIYNKCKKSNVRYVVSHRRLAVPLTNAIFLDPTNLVIDSISRDISEYIKAKFYADSIDINEIKKIVFNYNLNNDEMNILLSRLLFPSYYFDLFDKIINNKDDDLLCKIIDKIMSYENFLNIFYHEFSYYNLCVVDWIKK